MDFIFLIKRIKAHRQQLHYRRMLINFFLNRKFSLCQIKTFLKFVNKSGTLKQFLITKRIELFFFAFLYPKKCLFVHVT